MASGEKIMELKRILLVAPVYQKLEIFKEYLNSLNHLIVPDNYQLDQYFIITNSPDIEKILSSNQYEVDNCDFKSIKPKGTHFWEDEHYNSVMMARNKLLKKAREEKYDYMFSVDTDVLLHPKTLQLLIKDNKDLVSTIYWNKASFNKNIIVPNCYDLEYWKWWEDNTILKQKGLYKRGVLQAAILLGPRILQNEKIDYSPIPNLECSKWEDYALSLKAHIAIPDLQVYIDTRLPARHLYMEEDYQRWIREKNMYEIQFEL